MARALRLLAASALLLVPLAACSLLVDTSGLSGATTSAGDAAPGADGATTSDSASGADGATTSDARLDEAGDAADAAADVVDSSAPECTRSATTICDSFDDFTPGSTWTANQVDRGAVTFDAVGLSPPHALEAKIVAGSGTGDAALIQTYAGMRTHVRCDFDLNLKTVPAAGEIDVLDIITKVPGSEQYHVYFGSFDSSWSVAEFQGGNDGGTLDRMMALPAALPTNTWFHVELDQTGTSVTLTANGLVASLGALTLPAGTETSVTLGITYASGTVQSAGVLVDNVACTVLP